MNAARKPFTTSSMSQRHPPAPPRTPPCLPLQSAFPSAASYVSRARPVDSFSSGRTGVPMTGAALLEEPLPSPRFPVPAAEAERARFQLKRPSIEKGEAAETGRSSDLCGIEPSECEAAGLSKVYSTLLFGLSVSMLPGDAFKEGRSSRFSCRAGPRQNFSSGSLRLQGPQPTSEPHTSHFFCR